MDWANWEVGVKGKLSEQIDVRAKSSWRTRAATVEGWSALVLAFGSWYYALLPRVDNLMPRSVKDLLWDFFPCLPAAIGFGLAVAGIRYGTTNARRVSWWVLGLLLPLLIKFGWDAARRAQLL